MQMQLEDKWPASLPPVRLSPQEIVLYRGITRLIQTVTGVEGIPFKQPF